MHDLVAIKDRIVTMGYPELSQVRIRLDWVKSKDAYFEYGTVGGDYFIDVDRKLRNSSIPVIEGGMAHEISHILLDHSLNPVLRFLDDKLHSYWERYQVWDERRTDILTIERGFGSELIEFTKYANKRREKFTKKDCLSLAEMRRVLRGGTVKTWI